MNKENFNEQKQDADKDKSPENVERDGFNAEEIGEASIYDSTAEVAQQMRRGDETKGNPNDRDAMGASDQQETKHGRDDKTD